MNVEELQAKLAELLAAGKITPKTRVYLVTPEDWSNSERLYEPAGSVEINGGDLEIISQNLK